MIPIIGGAFSETSINGEALPYGEDWQFVRPDGNTELNARYFLQTEDGIVSRIANKALIHTPVKGDEGGFYVKLVVDIEAPSKSAYDYLNHAVFLGILEILQIKTNEEAYIRVMPRKHLPVLVIGIITGRLSIITGTSQQKQLFIC